MSTTLTLTCSTSGAGARYTDGGRPGLRHLAIGRGGPADPPSMARGNTILGQPDHTAAVELTLSGGSWQLAGKGQMVLTGADMNWRLDGRPVKRCQIIELDGSHELRGGIARSGCRAYLCIRGNWDLPRVMGSVEPGLPGTAAPGPGNPVSIVANDGLPESSATGEERTFPDRIEISVHPGPEWTALDEGCRRYLETQGFVVDPASDRQGVRLRASVAPPTSAVADILSSPVLPGTVQWTPSGPIFLGPDAQTVGGYLRVLVAEEWPSELFQLRPGGEVRLKVIRGGL